MPYRIATARNAASILLVLIVPGFLCSVASAADFHTGMSAYHDGDYATAYDEWLPLAEDGSAPAQFNLGLLYRYGKGRPTDPETALVWYRKAAESDFAPAQYETAEMYEGGLGVERDPIEAYKWFKLAAEKKYEDARKRRKKLANRMTSTEIALAEMWLREWKKGQAEAR